ncbi:LamG-like jellyroll fold domain-containing protein [Streptomyces pseudogriseolus]|uniref:LamG domain-containing protein n=1 Tax=Streptomyces pseudogriseolus TaxID=36817 RepID=UPI003FA2BC6A
MNWYSGRRVRSVAAATGLAALLLAAAPGVASAAGAAGGNLPPLQPRTDDLTASYRSCSEDVVYVGAAPELRAVVADSTEDNAEGEANRAGAEFEAWWTDGDGVRQQRAFTTSPLHSPVTALWRTPDDLPPDTVVSWHVRAVDDQGAVSAWSDEAPGHTCRFVIDTVGPQPAAVVSDRYPDDDSTWHDGVGVHGSFTFDSPSEDVVEYVYSFRSGLENRVRPAEPGGPATIRWMPERSGVHTLQVRALDRAGRSSAVTTHTVRVAEGRSPVAHWKLDDPAGSTTAGAEAGPVLRAGQGVVFGVPGPSRTGLTSAVALDGRGDSHLATDAPVTDTDGTFAVSAWVRPAATGTPMTVASQDTADGGSAFTLGALPADDGTAVWSFRLGTTTLTGGSLTAGKWTRLTGMRDGEDNTLRLYVDGTAVATGTGAAPVGAPGAFQVGRARGEGGARWRGEVADVRVWDRVVTGEEIDRLASRPAELAASWDIERTDDGVVPDRTGTLPLTLHGGASFTPDDPFDALDGSSHLLLNGTDGYAATGGPVVDTSESYSVGLRVRFADDTTDRPMTLLSEGNADHDAFAVRHNPATSEWQLVVTDGSGPDAGTTVTSGYAYHNSWGDEVVLVFDDAAGRVTLYVQGNAVVTAEHTAPWSSTGPLQIGRGHTSGGEWGDHLKGGVDTVRVFRGALTEQQVVMYAYLF